MLNKRKPIHPGHLFKEEVLATLGLTVTKAAKDLGVTRKTLSEFLNNHSSLSPGMAIRIGKATGTSPESWLNMQSKLDLWKAMQKSPEVVPFPNQQIFDSKDESKKRNTG